MRSSPISALKSDDLPTFGRPRIATRIASSPTAGRASPMSSSRATTSSSRSPVPWPCIPESGSGSPSPSRCSSSASGSCAGSSILFASTSTGLCAARRISASSSSPGMTPGARVDDEAARGRPRATACRACSTIERETASLLATSTPPVSMSRNCFPAHSQTSSLRSRVVPLVSWTTAARLEVSRLISVDLPTFGIADDRDRPEQVVLDLLGVFDVAHSGGVSPRGRPRACTSASQSKRTLRRRSISRLALLVALPAPRHALEPERLADRDRAGREVPRASRTACRRPRSARRARRPGSRPSPRPAARARGASSPSAASPRRRAPIARPARAYSTHRPHRVAVGLAAADGDDPVPVEEPPESRARAGARPSRRS